MHKAPPAVIAPLYNWSGFYIGINGGGGWGRSRFDFGGVGTTTGDFSLDGGMIGGTIGINWQAGAMVYGIEGDFDWSGIRGSSDNRPTLPVAGGFICNGPVAAGGNGFTCHTDNRWLATVRGRLGYAASNWMPYITGGLAIGDVRARIDSDPLLPVFGGDSDIRAGWTLGAGVEVALSQAWSVKAEYLYVDLGSFSCQTQAIAGGPGCSGVTNTDVEFRTHLVRAGINYRFNMGGPVMASY
jgi:outer membrane immunogenic protein